MKHISEFAVLYRKVTSRRGGEEEEEDNDEGRRAQTAHALGNESMNADVITNVVSSLATLQIELS